MSVSLEFSAYGADTICDVAYPYDAIAKTDFDDAAPDPQQPIDVAADTRRLWHDCLLYTSDAADE